MTHPRIIVYENEPEFAGCLRDLLVGAGAQVCMVASYDELLVRLEEGPEAMLICDLSFDKTTEVFLRGLTRLTRPPVRSVFTSIYSDVISWPALRDFRGAFIFIPKPFRAQTLITFLFPPSSDLAPPV